MLEWLAYQLPWRVWIIVAVLVVGIVYRLFGLRNALVAAGAFAAAVFLNRARQQGWKDREARIREDRLKAARDRKDSDDEIDRLGADQRNSEWDRWLRDKR
ncbi:hypothetical protein [Neorhizobium galegae]|uniref:hypothetical protein n=1 Tax=Neorhizobium galegae TaxID=399 RepID=UPI000621192C|nr:hypothetical protein [Neorhizobium galegae]CDZ55092.1 Hypothetical protein NGAL_HAMBI2427_59940 [Neorhizobium galegae bv. orientalis]